MSAAAAAAIPEVPVYLETAPVNPQPIDAVRDFIHDLRQPLSSIEAIAYYLEMTLPPGPMEARQYMRRLQHLVEQANSVLQQAACDLRKPVRSAAKI